MTPGEHARQAAHLIELAESGLDRRGDGGPDLALVRAQLATAHALLALAGHVRTTGEQLHLQRGRL